MPPHKLTLISWNLLAPIWAQCREYPVLGLTCRELAFARRQKQVQHQLKHTNMEADLYLFQEVDPDWLSFLQRTLGATYDCYFLPHGRYHWAEQYHAPSGTSDTSPPPLNGNAILVRKTHTNRGIRSPKTSTPTLSVQQTYVYHLDARGNRALAMDVRWNGQTIHVVNVHLDDRHAARRHQQLTLLECFIRLRTHHTPVIVGGDFNTSRAHSLLCRALPTYQWSAPHTRPTHIHQKQPLRIDFIFWGVPKATLSKTPPKEALPEASHHTTTLGVPPLPTTLRDLLSRTGSDHLPVCMKIA